MGLLLLVEHFSFQELTGNIGEVQLKVHTITNN